MKAVKLRIKSVQNTMQITKAMELVASSKLRRAKERAETCRPYFVELYDTLKKIAYGNTEFTSVYAKEPKSEKICYVVTGIILLWNSADLCVVITALLSLLFR